MSSRFCAAPTVISGGVGPGVDRHQTDRFTATQGQTVFSLSKTPVDNNDVEFEVNGVEYTNGTDYLILGTTLTWQNILFTLIAGDKIKIDYPF